MRAKSKSMLRGDKEGGTKAEKTKRRGNSSETRMKGGEDEILGGFVVGSTVITGAANRTDVLVRVIVSAGFFGSCELEEETYGIVAVSSHEFTIPRFQESLLAFLRDLFSARRELVTGTEANEASGGGTLVVSRGIIWVISASLAIIRIEALGARR